MPATFDWGAAMAAHQASLDRFVAAARRVPGAQWETPLAPGKWTPAQQVEHIRLVYEVLGNELGGGPGLAIRTRWWQRLLLRLKVLPGILNHGRIPARAPAPREARPGPGPFPQDAVIAATLAAAATMQQHLEAARHRPGAGVTHHIFGRLSLAEVIRFGAVHNDHHTRQLEGQ